MKYMVRVDGTEHTVVVEGSVVSVDGEAHDARLVDIPGSPARLLTVDNRVYPIVVEPAAPGTGEGGGGTKGEYRLSFRGYRVRAEAFDERLLALRALELSRRPAGPAVIVAPMPGLIVRVQVKEGDAVSAGQGVVVMEAMKMENELRAPNAGVVRRVHVAPGMAVEKGAALLEVDTDATRSD